MTPYWTNGGDVFAYNFSDTPGRGDGFYHGYGVGCGTGSGHGYGAGFGDGTGYGYGHREGSGGGKTTAINADYFETALLWASVKVARP